MLLLKAALYSIRMFDRVSSSLREVFSYNPSNKDWEPTPGVVPKWPGPTNEPPSDEPFCGFMNEKPWCHQSRSSSPEIALIISILVILVFSVISFATFRFYRRKKEVNSIDRWILDAADMIPRRVSRTSPMSSSSSHGSTQQVVSETSSSYPYMYYIC
ncbi:hypothetical protein RvY_05132-2 [Ramazzottius varieornatus]|uniref:Uncharacterized protein n=1 Tax=Ramazzottius varieornatus TaxID=947166 RepID=A0A1D1V3W1_RAMVA|nr:hypothetical protein RvY_05132-2 [Ramazzottius varieornatus]